MEYEEAKKKIVEELTKKAEDQSPSSISTIWPKFSRSKPREAKKIVNKMVEEGVLEYWSSGSTSMYGMPGTGKQAAAEHEEKEE